MELTQPNHDSYVYNLRNSLDSRIFYVGRGTIHEGKFDRYTDHIRKARQGSELWVHRKIRKILDEGGSIIFDILATGLTFEESQEMERKLIESIGLDNLTNITAGGDDHPLKDADPIRRDEFIGRIKAGMVDEQRKIYLTKESGECWIFESGVKAAEFLGVSPQAICQAARRKKTSKGYLVSYT